MNFTDNQQNAINVRDCSLIISAGAGSGKTAVLTERILERICDENDDCNIDDFLIVTFSRAAAKELNDRIRKKLASRAEEQPDNGKIIRNMALMPLAKIMTINAFCYELVRENFQKLGLSASVRIADESEIEVIREKIMNEVIDTYFESPEKDVFFLTAYEIFASSKNDSGFISTLLSLDRKLDNVIDRKGFCESVIKDYREMAEGADLFSTAIGKRIAAYIKERADKTMSALDEAMSACGQYDILKDKYLPVIQSGYEFARSVYHAANESYDKTADIVNSYVKMTFAGRNIPKTFENPALKTAIAGTKSLVSDGFLSEMKKLCCCSGTLMKNAAGDCANVLLKIFEIVNNFKCALDERKKELGIIEFSDAERYTLSLLADSYEPFKASDFAHSLSERFKEIYIDEYQDVNPLQDTIFKAISKQREEGGECNRFMVGDIKQSIYRFRGARSEIFMNYRDSFDDIDSSSDRAKRIFMSDNFRCSESVIRLTNRIFSNLMGSFYGEGDALKFSRTENVRVPHKVKLVGFEYNSEAAGGLSTPELEAAIICDKIKNIINNPEFTDSDGKTFTYSDIGILAHNRDTLKVYESVMNSAGIPTFCNFGESFYAKKEVILCINILNAIDNPERDIYLAGFMRSFAGGFSDNELAIIKKSYSKMSLYRAVINYSEGGKDENLAEKCRVFMEKLRLWRSFSRGKSAEKLVWKIFNETDMLNICSSRAFTNDPQGARKNLLKLYQMAREYSKTSFKGIGAFIEYINSTIENGDIKAERVLSGNCVTLMTVHASKGLEFPVCFVTNLSKRFNKSDEKEKLVFSETGGIGIKLCDTEGITCVDSRTGLVNIDTPFRTFACNITDSELCAEETRVLYVALTRARDMLFLTSSFPKKIENAMSDIMSYGMSKRFDLCNNCFSLITSALAFDGVLSPFYVAAGMDVTPNGFGAEEYLECEHISAAGAKDIYDNVMASVSADEADNQDDGIDMSLLEELERLGNFSFEKSALPSKITVSRLKKGLIDEQDEVQQDVGTEENVKRIVPQFILGEKKADGAEKGTAMHLFMQFCNFEESEKNIEKEADRLFEEGFIDERQRNLLDTQRLSEFFASDFYRVVKASRSIYREQRFNLSTDALDASFPKNVLVQGVIDLFYQNDDGTYTVVDFKTDRVFGDGAEQVLIERHKQQLMYYKRAVEEMTGMPVSKTVIYSFSLMKEIDIE